MVASRRRRVPPRALEGIGRGYREERRAAGIAFVRKKKRQGGSKGTFDTIG